MESSHERSEQPMAWRSRVGWASLFTRCGLGVMVVVSLAFVYWFARRDNTELSWRATGVAAVASGERMAIRRADVDRPKSLADTIAERYDPAEDEGWNSEVLSSAAASQLRKLSKLLEHPEDLDRDAIDFLVGDDFSCSVLRPDRLTEVLNTPSIIVQRWEQSVTTDLAPVYRGSSGLVEALKHLLYDLGTGLEFRAHFKLYRIEQTDDLFTTRVFFEALDRTASRGLQQNAVWRCQWTPGTSSRESPILRSIAIETFEQVVAVCPGGSMFVDCTESAMGANVTYEQQILMGLSVYALHGLAVGDANGDDLEDVYVCDAGGLPNRLYLQNQDGTVTDVSSQAGVDWLEQSMSALFIDLNNDGHQDLVVATAPAVIMAENDGSGRFVPRGGTSSVFNPLAMCAADYDDDGDLDVYVCGYAPSSERSQGLPAPLPYHDANNGGTNILLRNEGNFKFKDVTTEVGLDQNNTRYSQAAAWEDYDNDGDMDLYVANDFGRNNLYQNVGGRFHDVAGEVGVEDIASGMSVAWGDYNLDGWMDLYVSNMFSAAGSRVTYQRNFAPGHSAVLKSVQRMARGNSLFANSTDGTFHDVSETAAVTMGRWAWASKFADLNNDTWPDLIVANGFVSNEDTEDL